MQDGDMVEFQFNKKIRGRGRGEAYSWLNGIDIYGGSFIEVYNARASSMGDGDAFGGLVGKALDHATAGEGAAGNRRDNNLLLRQYIRFAFSLPCDTSSFSVREMRDRDSVPEYR